MIRMEWYNDLLNLIDEIVMRAYDGNYYEFLYDYLYNGDVDMGAVLLPLEKTKLYSYGYDCMPLYDAALSGMDIHSDAVYAEVVNDLYCVESIEITADEMEALFWGSL